jgi:glutathione S-transferase
MSLKLYGFPVSQPTRAVCMLLDDAGIPYENVMVSLPAKQQKTKEFMAINPTGQVPAIDDDGFFLAEGAAILTYLTESRSLSNVYPADVKQRAKVNYWLHWNHHNTRQSTFKLLRPTVFKKAITPEGRASFANTVSILEAHLATSTFLVGNSLTLADYFILPELDQVEWLGAAVFDYSPYPNVLRYLETVKGAIGSYTKNAAPAKNIVEGVSRADKLKLYGFVVSQPTRSLLMILDEAKIAHDFVPVNILKGEHKQAEFLAVNPAGQVPALDDNGFSLGESCAIIQYLAESRGLDTLYPEDTKTRGRIHFWLHWNHTNTRASTTKFLRPILHGQAVTESDRAAFNASIGFLEDHLSRAENRFVAGTDGPSVADFILLPELDQLQWLTGAFDFGSFPHVSKYVETCKTQIGSYGAHSEPAKAIVESIMTK